MPITEVMSGIFTDTAMEDGYVAFSMDEDEFEAFTMSPVTFRALVESVILGPATDAVAELGEGTHLIPRSAIEQAHWRDLEPQLQFIEPGDSDTCCLPTCQQESVTRERGYPLCAVHSAQHADWDSLVG